MMNKNFFIKLFLFFSPVASAFANSIMDPCSLGLFSLINRPSITGSACVVPNKKILVEAGYQYYNLTGGASAYFTPLTEIRFGLPGNNEFLLALPSYYHQTISPRAGWNAVTLSAKHEIGYNANWLGAIEGLLTLPTGSENYGSKAFGGTVNGIVTYTFDPVFSITGMLGVMSQSVQYLGNGQRFNSVNPDLVVSWQFAKWMVFGELYAQTRTGPGEGLGLITDGGVYYLPTPNLSLDLGIGQRVSGNWGFQTYATAGLAFLFG